MAERILHAADRLILQDGGTVDRPEWDCDVVTAKYECKTSLIQNLIPKWGDPHPVFRPLTKVSHRLREAKHGMTSLDVTYRGLIDGIAPPVRIRNSLVLADVTLQMALNIEGLDTLFEPTIEVSVYLPETTYEYFVTKKPKGPKYRGKLNYIEGAFEVAARRGSQRNGAINIIVDETLRAQMAKGSEVAGGEVLPTRAAGMFNGFAVVLTTGYDDIPIADKLWKITEKTGVRILPKGGNDRFLTLSGA